MPARLGQPDPHTVLHPPTRPCLRQAYWRPGFGNHRVVSMREAPHFFGPCPLPECHRSKATLYDDWFPLTPYSLYKPKYK